MMNSSLPEGVTLDLGSIDEPIVVFGGPYSNLQATQAMLEAARHLSIPPERMICTGDVVAYCANPVETIAAIRSSGAQVVMGNCEESLGLRLDDCGCGFEQDTVCDILSRQWFTYTDALLSDDDRAWLRTRPRRIIARMGGRSLAFIHGSASDISGWVFQSTEPDLKSTDLDALECDAIVAGHCGIPFIQRLPHDRLWINAGVIGMPANDGTQRGWFTSIAPKESGLDIQMHPLRFDTTSAAHAMRKAHLPEAYAKALETGLWPNMDVLPEQERLQQGDPLGEINLVWARDERNVA